jgi:DNA-binding response OmpR family regulator
LVLPTQKLCGITGRALVARVLIIEDDDVIARGIQRHLADAGFDAYSVSSGETGLARLRYERPDVCVLDLMLPGTDGWRLIETARDEESGRRSWSSARAGRSTTASTLSSSARTTTS